jgi:hypothetical protein
MRGSESDRTLPREAPHEYAAAQAESMRGIVNDLAQRVGVSDKFAG